MKLRALNFIVWILCVAAAKGAVADDTPDAGPQSAAVDPEPESDEQVDEAEERAPRRRDATWREIFGGPFTSPRLFQVPVANTVGPYVMSLSYDGSLLTEPGVLSSAGVFAIGVGDIAQLEYRHTSAISIDRSSAPVPAVGVQIVAPLPIESGWPTIAGAFRLGVPRRETPAGFDVDETVTDLYLVGAWRLPGQLDRLTLHGGVRVSPAKIEIAGNGIEPILENKTLVLPSGGLEWQVNDTARIVLEAGLVPRFLFDPTLPEMGADVETGVQGRVGMRWVLHPVLSIDASLGYQVDAATLDGLPERSGGAVVDWDIRLGGELFIPWGAISCRTLGVFCQ